MAKTNHYLGPSSFSYYLFDSTKLKLPYARTDDFTYDLFDKSTSDKHYTKDSDGNIVWNVYFSKSSEKQADSSAAKNLSFTVDVDTDKDGKSVITVTPKGNSKVTSADDTSNTTGSNAPNDSSSASSNASDAKSDEADSASSTSASASNTDAKANTASASTSSSEGIKCS